MGVIEGRIGRQPAALDPGRPVALVTGGARRVGRAIAQVLTERGCSVVVTYRSSDDEARSLHEDGGCALALRLDLDDLAAVESTGAALARELPRLDVLVHNASMYRPCPLADATVSDALRLLRIHAVAPLLLSRDLAPLLAAKSGDGPGAIVAMLDMHVLGRPRDGFADYAMSKAALVELVRSLAIECAPRVRVNGVAPGVVAFPESGYESDAAARERYLERVPLGRSGTPEEAAAAVAWLALDAGYCTGQIVRLDGGRWLA